MGTLSPLLSFMRGIHRWPVESGTLMFLWCQSEQTVEQTLNRPGIFDAMPLMWCRCNDHILFYLITKKDVLQSAKCRHILYMLFFFSFVSADSWWCHQMGTFSALLVICVGKPPVTGGFPSQRPVTWVFDVFFDLRLNKRFSKQSKRRSFGTPSRSLLCHPEGYGQADNNKTQKRVNTWMPDDAFMR